MRMSAEINHNFFKIKDITLLKNNPVISDILAENSEKIVKRLEEIEESFSIDPFFDEELINLVLPNDMIIPQQFKKSG